MPREIKTTIAVDGEAAFKRAINDANTSIRNMGTQLSLATAQFKKDGDAMKLMESRSKTLKSEIEQQEEIVKALEKAVKDSTTAYGENSDKTEKWEAELNRAKTRLVNLQSELTLNNAGLDRNGNAFDSSAEKAADYQATLQTVGRGISFENITSGVSRITSGLEGAITKVFNFAKAMRDTMVDAGHWADDLMTDATKYNMDVEELQRWRNAADFIDTDVETIVNAKSKLENKMYKGWEKTEGKNKINLWELYGIDIGTPEDYRDSMDVLFDVGELLTSIAQDKSAGGEVRADAVAMDLFGKSYREMLPLFSAGRDEWERTVAEQRVVSAEHVQALADMDDANNQLENSWEILKNNVLADIAPVMTDAATALSGLLNEFNDWIETDEGKEAMKGLAEALRELFSGLGDIKFKDAIETAKNALNDLKKALEWINKHKDDVKTALTIIAGGFGLLKVTELATNIGKIAEGFRTIFSYSGKKFPTIPTTVPTTPTGGGSGSGGGSGTGSGGSGSSGGKSGPLAVIGNFMRTPLAKILGWTAAFGTTLFQNAITEQGNDDILDKDGELTESARDFGFYKNENGEVRNERTEPVILAEKPETTEETLKGVGSELTDAQKEAAEAWWDAYREEMTSDTAGGDSDEKWEALEATFGDNQDLLERLDSAIDSWLTDSENEDNSFFSRDSLLDALQPAEKEPEEVEEFVDLDPVYSLADKLDAVQDWWDAYRNAENGVDSSDEEWNAFEYLQEVLGDEFADFWTTFLERSEGKDLSGLDDLPESYTQMLTDNSDLLDDAVQEMRQNTETGRSVAEKVAGMDIKRFNTLPSEIQSAVLRGAASGVSGIVVRLDGNAVGKLVAPYVNSYLGGLVT